MKPEAPLEYRGEFRPIPTTAPEIQVCEHLPLLAHQMRHFALVRSVRHNIVDHNAGAYYALTGQYPVEGAASGSGQLIVRPSAKLFPSFGAVLAQLRPTGRALPDFVHVPEVLSNNGYDLPGQFGGFLGAAGDPYIAGDPSLPGFEPRDLLLRPETSPERFRRRQRLLSHIGAGEPPVPVGQPALRQRDEHYRKAFELLGSSAARRAFDLGEEDETTRERYGFDHKADRKKLAREFGGLPHLGQSMLLARRLIEAGVRLVTVCTGRRYCQAWDTHRKHFPLLKESLLPMTDRAFSTLIADLEERGLLKETLVVAMGEFGRTPRVGQITSSAGADAGGRDHWPHCYTVLFAGAGVQGGAVYGASDRYAAYPAHDPVRPEDVAATIYEVMGVDPATELRDPLGRPLPLAAGTPIQDILA
jgi:hypothetical protein